MSGTLLGVTLFCGGLALAVWGVWRRRGVGTCRGARLQPVPLLPGELAEVYRRLQQALPQHHVFAQVGLERLLRVAGGDPAAVADYRQQLQGQSVDFLVCNEALETVAAVEVEEVVLGDPQIEQRARLLRAAGLPVLRWTTARLPEVEELREAIAELETLERLQAARQVEPAARPESG